MLSKRYRALAKTLVGNGLDLLSPRLGAEIESGAASGSNVKLRKWVLHARLENARRRGDDATVQKLLHLFWQGDTSAEFYDRYTDRFDLWFLGRHQEIVEALIRETYRRKYHQLIEVGCGDGRVLAHLAKRLASINTFIGIDINSAIVGLNRRVHASDKKLSFLAGNAPDLIDDIIGDGTILMTYGGVMEYFSEAELLRLFMRIARQAGTAVALVEPVNPVHNLLGDRHSHIFGDENSFSHNHRCLLETAGFNIEHSNEMTFGGVRWIVILACRD